MTRDVLPTANDRQHIGILAQRLADVVQDYARENGLTFSGVMSAIGTALGGLLARAYDDEQTMRDVAQRIPIAAIEMAKIMQQNDPLIRARRSQNHEPSPLGPGTDGGER